MNYTCPEGSYCTTANLQGLPTTTQEIILPALISVIILMLIIYWINKEKSF